MKTWLEFINAQTEAEEKRMRVAAGFSEDGERFIGTLKEADKWAQELGLSFTSAFEDAVVGGKKFREILRGIAQDIARLILRETVTKRAGNAITSVLGNIFEGIFGGGKAAGGPVAGGRTYLVGEEGPELFTPGASGSITPNHALGGVGGVNIVQNIHVDSRSDRASIMRAMKVAKDEAVATVADAMMRGGVYASAFSR